MSFLQKMKVSLEPVSGIPVLGENKPEWANVGVTIYANIPSYTKSTTSSPETSPISNIITYTDTNIVKQIDPKTLEPTGIIQQQRCHPHLVGPLSCAHTQVDPASGDIYNYNLEFGATPTYRIFRTLQSTGETEILATLSGSGISAAYIHSFFMTADFVILCLWPSFFAAAGAKVPWERNILASLAKFDPRAETRWLVVDRIHSQGLVATFNSPAIFSYHTINAWQEDAGDGKVNIFCDIVQYPNLDNLHALYYDTLMSTGPKALKSYDGKNNTTRPSFARYRLSNVPKGSNQSVAPRINQIPKADLLFQLPPL
jgi:torulene dioxygenase